MISITDLDGKGIRVEGHANYGEYGKDIVCASISTLVYSFSDYLEKNRIKFSENISDGFYEIKISDEEDKYAEALKLVLYGCEGVARTYPDYVKMNSAEVG